MAEVRQRRSYGRDGVDLVVHLDAGEVAALGPDAAELLMWVGDVLDGLTALRTGAWVGDTDRTRAETYRVVSALRRGLRPRLDGLLAAAVRAHQDAGVPVRHLREALGVAHPSGVQYMRNQLSKVPGEWELWATGGPQPDP